MYDLSSTFRWSVGDAWRIWNIKTIIACNHVSMELYMTRMHRRTLFTRPRHSRCSSSVTITTNFKMPQSHEKQTFSWWRRDREMRADRKFKWDLRRSLARKSIVITSADRTARLILRTIYDGPIAQDRSRRSPNELGIEDWSSTETRLSRLPLKMTNFSLYGRNSMCRYYDLESW